MYICLCYVVIHYVGYMYFFDLFFLAAVLFLFFYIYKTGMYEIIRNKGEV